MPSILSCLCCERESAKFTGRTLSVLGRHADRAPFNEASSEFASTWLSQCTYHAFGEAMLRTSAARQMLPLSHAGVTISYVSFGLLHLCGSVRKIQGRNRTAYPTICRSRFHAAGTRRRQIACPRSAFTAVGARSSLAQTDVFVVYAFAFAQWPSANSNGYAFYHRVDRVNGGDANATHTTGFGKKQRFWYK